MFIARNIYIGVEGPDVTYNKHDVLYLYIGPENLENIFCEFTKRKERSRRSSN